MQYVPKMRPIIKKVGDMVMSHFLGAIEIHKKNDRSIATNIDLISEEILKNELCVMLPCSGFIAEETKIQEIREFTWVIDPIDGTKNFARGIPYFCINVALMHEADVIAAVTYAPATQQWFWAERGKGAFRNGIQIIIDDNDSKPLGLLAVISDFRFRHADLTASIKNACKPYEHDVRFRINGAAALDLAYAAAGCFDVVIFENLQWWDAAAGTLLITEAKGMICQHDGSPINASFTSLIAGSPNVCKLILPILNA